MKTKFLVVVGILAGFVLESQANAQLDSSSQVQLSEDSLRRIGTYLGGFDLSQFRLVNRTMNQKLADWSELEALKTLNEKEKEKAEAVLSWRRYYDIAWNTPLYLDQYVLPVLPDMSSMHRKICFNIAVLWVHLQICDMRGALRRVIILLLSERLLRGFFLGPLAIFLHEIGVTENSLSEAERSLERISADMPDFEEKFAVITE